MSAEAGSRRSLAVIYATVALDAAGIGLVFPILPRLIQDVTHTPNVAPYVGWMAALYAAMQCVFAPVLGALSDRLGRRPVLLVSLAGAALNYGVMALAPQLWMLMLGRAVAGLTGANVSVATAYITDITLHKLRARRFGMVSAMFGAVLIVGPVLGGALGEQWVRLPFIAAAALMRATCRWLCSPCRSLMRHRPAASISPRSILCGRCAGCCRCRACGCLSWSILR